MPQSHLMPQNCRSRTIHRWFPVLALFLTLAVPPPTWGYPGFESVNMCEDAMTLSLNSTTRGFGAESGAALTFRINIPTPGILAVDIAVPGGALSKPELVLVDRSCEKSNADEKTFTQIERGPSRWTAWIFSPGSYFFRVVARDPLLPLGSYRLKTSFVGGPLDGWEKVEEWEDENDPDGDPPPTSTAVSVAQMRSLCQSSEVDDHDDLWLCATELALGEIFVTPGRYFVRVESDGSGGSFGLEVVDSPW